MYTTHVVSLPWDCCRNYFLQTVGLAIVGSGELNDPARRRNTQRAKLNDGIIHRYWCFRARGIDWDSCAAPISRMEISEIPMAGSMLGAACKFGPP
jgi:hypothetical protein